MLSETVGHGIVVARNREKASFITSTEREEGNDGDLRKDDSRNGDDQRRIGFLRGGRDLIGEDAAEERDKEEVEHAGASDPHAAAVVVDEFDCGSGILGVHPAAEEVVWFKFGFAGIAAREVVEIGRIEQTIPDPVKQDAKGVGETEENSRVERPVVELWDLVRSAQGDREDEPDPRQCLKAADNEFCEQSGSAHNTSPEDGAIVEKSAICVVTYGV
jgi:hypothetical protein